LLGFWPALPSLQNRDPILDWLWPSPPEAETLPWILPALPGLLKLKPFPGFCLPPFSEAGNLSWLRGGACLLRLDPGLYFGLPLPREAATLPGFCPALPGLLKEDPILDSLWPSPPETGLYSGLPPAS
jgi:hypothetical protein